MPLDQFLGHSCSSLKFSLNIDKSNYVVFHSQQRKLHYNMNISISNEQIKHENQVKYLGLLTDRHLSWKPHLHELAKKISRGVGRTTFEDQTLCRFEHFETIIPLPCLPFPYVCLKCLG